MSDQQLPAKVEPNLEEQLEQIPEALDRVLQMGDFTPLTMRQRSIFLYKLAQRLELNPLTKPFDFIVANNKTILYANRTCADQLRRRDRIKSEVLYAGLLQLGDKLDDTVYVVRVKLWDGERSEEAVGCIGIAGLTGEGLSNAIMKCHTKAIRRGTLSFCGLGFIDSTEVDSIEPMGVGMPRRIIPAQPEFSAPMEEPVDVPPAPSIPAVPPPAEPTPVVPKAQSSTLPRASGGLPSVLPSARGGGK